MYAGLSDATRYLESIRHSNTAVTSAVHRNLVTGKVTTLPVLDGSVTDDATSNVRRTLGLTVPSIAQGAAGQPDVDMFSILDTPGGEITVTKTRRYIDGKREPVPMGVFVVDQNQIGYGPGGNITMTCPDRWLKVQRNRFGLTRASVPSHAAWQEIQRLVEAPWGGAFPGWAQLDTSATVKVGPLLWGDGDREAAILKLCIDNSLEVFFDRTGKGVLRPVPILTPTSTPVWTVDAGNDTAVMIDASRSRDMSRVRNAVILSTSATDIVFDPVEVKNTTAGDPLSVTGPLGYVPWEYSSPTLRNSTQARAAGLTILSRQLGTAKQLSLTAFCNDALDSGDVIRARLPRINAQQYRPVELHILDTITTPLGPTNSQDLQTRSTRPTTDGS
jgi:hypothetical protein